MEFHCKFFTRNLTYRPNGFAFSFEASSTTSFKFSTSLGASLTTGFAFSLKAFSTGFVFFFWSFFNRLGFFFGCFFNLKSYIFFARIVISCEHVFYFFCSLSFILVAMTEVIVDSSTIFSSSTSVDEKKKTFDCVVKETKNILKTHWRSLIFTQLLDGNCPVKLCTVLPKLLLKISFVYIKAELHNYYEYKK